MTVRAVFAVCLLLIAACSRDGASGNATQPTPNIGLRYLRAQDAPGEILDDYVDLESDDLSAVLAYAAQIARTG